MVIIGAGGFGREVSHFIDRGRYTLVGFIDPIHQALSNLPLPVLGDDSLIPKLQDHGIATSVCVALGSIKQRKNLCEKVLQNNLALPAIIHPSAVLLTDLAVGQGAIIYPNVVAMDNCRIGKGVLLNSGVTLGHDVIIGDYASVNPGAHLSGRVKVGREAMVGIGSLVREYVQIGDKAIVGAGSVVLRDVTPGATVYGVPAQDRTNN